MGVENPREKDRDYLMGRLHGTSAARRYGGTEILVDRLINRDIEPGQEENEDSLVAIDSAHEVNSPRPLLERLEMSDPSGKRGN